MSALSIIIAVIVGYILGRISILPNHVIAERLKSPIRIIKEGRATFFSPSAKRKADQLQKELE